MSLDSRSTRSALFKRAEQLKRWEESDTNREPSVINGDNRRIKFSAGCVFLAACAAGDKDEVLSLLKKGADIDTTNVDGLSALHQACIDDNLEMVEFLVEHGADVNKGDNEGWTPLHATASCGFISIAKYLMEKGASVAAVNHDGELPVDIAESDEMEDMLQQQIDLRGIDAEDARTEEQRIMLEDAKNWLSSGRLQEKVHPKTGATSLHVSAAKGYVKVMHILLEAGSDVDCVDFDGWTALHAAAHWGQKDACKILVEHFCDMEIKNYVGQTAFDVADSQMVSYLEELRKKQSSLSRLSYNKKKNNNNIQSIESIETRKERLERLETEKYEESNDEIKNKVPQVPQIEVQIQPVPNDNQSRIEMKNYIKKEDSNRISPPVEVTKQVPTTPAPLLPPRSIPVEDDDTNVPSWRRPGSFRSKEDTPKFNLPLRISDREVKTNERMKEPKAETPQEVVLRRTQSFEADEKFYRRYLELRAKINAGNNNYSVINSPARSASLKEKHFARRGQVKEDPRYGGGTSVTLPTITPAGYTRSPVTSPATTPTSPTTVAPPVPSSPVPCTVPSPVSPVTSPVPTTTSTPSFVTLSSTLTTTSSSSTPTTSPQHTNQVRRLVNALSGSGMIFSSSTPTTPASPGKRSPATIFKNFFKSFVPPVRDEESETQRKAHAKRVRETRRSTQGVTLEEIKSAEQLVKKKQQEAAIAAVSAASTPPIQQEPPGSPEVIFTLPSSLVSSQSRDKVENTAESKESPTKESAPGGGAHTFMLEDARTTKDEENDREPVKESPTKNSVETGETTVTLPLRRNRTEDREQDKENDSRTGQATQGVIQRRRKPKRRSTGVVKVDMDEIDPERNSEANDTSNDVDVSFRINCIQSGGEKEKTDDAISRVSQSSAEQQQVDDSESASENGELDYKKLYEESQVENQKLRDKLKKSEDDLTRAKLMSEKVPYVPMRNSLSEAEKREKKAMERKLSEMEEELKQLEQLKCENQKLKDENGALIRVISKLSK